MLKSFYPIDAHQQVTPDISRELRDRLVRSAELLDISMFVICCHLYHWNPCNLGKGAEVDVTRNKRGIVPLL